MGQGAGMTIESAVLLARSLAEGKDPEDSLRRYQAARMTRTAWIIEQSRKIARMGAGKPPRLRPAQFGAAPHPPALMKKQLETAAGYEV